MTTFDEELARGYGFEGPALVLGAALHEGRPHHPPHVRIPLAMLNRHGLVAGATGTGKTRSLQLLAEQCSAQGIPVFAADVKGDLAGIARPGTNQSDMTAGGFGRRNLDIGRHDGFNEGAF